MQENFDVYIVPFINKTDIIEEVNDGYSGALLYKIIRGKNKFFLKVFNRILNITKIEDIIYIYKKLKIKSLNIIDFGNIDKLNRSYIVYNFVEGENLKIYTNTDDYNLDDIRNIGAIIGQKLLKLKTYKDYNNCVFKNTNVDDIINKAIMNLNILLENEPYKNVLLKYFCIDDIYDLRKKLIKFSDLFKNIDQVLIHGDIKRANIMIDESKELCITDIESMQVSYDVLNFRYQITWSLFDKNEKEAAFIKGYFDGIYFNKRPDNFNYMIIFTIILNFFEESYKRFKNSNINGFDIYVKNCKSLFDKINKVNIDIEYII